jgi:hypothetical protein
MAKRYKILPGHKFTTDTPGEVLTGGQFVQLEDDVAALHPDKIELAEEAEAAGDAVQTSARTDEQPDA